MEVADDMQQIQMVTETETETERLANERRAYVQGLRELAAFVETHAVPLPYAGSANAYVLNKADLASIARSTGMRWQKSADDNFFYIRVQFSGRHSYDVNVSRESVCRKVVTGTRIEPAKPATTVEEFHWVCDEPLLAEGGPR